MESAIEFLYHVLAADGMPKFDSGASRCMSGDPARLRDPLPIPHRRVTITGFNSQSSSEPTMMGVNADGKQEYYVSDMPRHLTLLCANAYCQDGCAVLFAHDGLVLRMTADELSELKNFLISYPVTIHLRVRNRTYEVDEANISDAAVFGVDTATSGVSAIENRYERTPEIVQLAHPTQVRHATGLRSDPEQPTRTGESVQIDCMYGDYNIRV